jgi:hypothetical protein
MSIKTCSSCNNEPTKLQKKFETDICDNCYNSDDFNYISKTDAKKKYKLKDSDLDNLICDMITHSKYKNIMCLYKKKDIIDIADSIKDEIEQNELIKQNKKISIKKKRETTVLKILNNSEITNIMSNKIIIQYIENGGMTIKNLKIYIDRITKLEKENIKDLLPSHLYDKYISGEISIDELKFYCNRKTEIGDFINELIIDEEYIEEYFINKTITAKDLKDMNERKKELIKRLEERNLVLRNDSTYCSEYIYENKRNINEVLNMVEEMNFFYTKTGYPQILRNIYRENRDYYIDFSESTKNSFSATAKKIALKEFKKQGNIKDIPSFLQ